MARGRSLVLASVLAAALFAPAAPAAAAPDVTPPPEVTNLTARPADQRVYLSWTYPTMPSDWQDVVVRRYIGSTTVTPTGPEAVTIHAGRGTTFIDAGGLTNGVAVNYAVFSRDVTGNYSAAVQVLDQTPISPPATSLTATSSAARVRYGEATVIHGELLRADTGAAVVGETLEFYARNAGKDWGLIGHVKTAPDGTADLSFTPRAHSEFQVKHVASVFFGASESNLPSTQVQPLLSSAVDSVFVGTDQPVVMVGAVHPPHPGQRVYLQRRVGTGPWMSVASSALSRTSTYRLAVVNVSTGTFEYRVFKPADSDHLSATGTAVKVTVSPRTLRMGMSGRDVLALQQQLARLHYDVGAINGTFGYDTLHAVVPFQKVNGLERTGVVDGPVRARLARPIHARLIEKRAGNSVEIDIGKQVLIAGTNGTVTRVLDISSGNNAFYVSDGVRYKATTPRGHFRIQRKINGIRVSRLGELYRPAYFTGGYAIHGSRSVPPRAASHGCIRVTNPSQDRQYNLLTIGTSVWIF